MEPKAAYLAFEGLNGVGDAWSKIFQEGYDGTWAVDKLLSSGGKVNSLGVSDRWLCGLNGFL